VTAAGFLFGNLPEGPFGYKVLRLRRLKAGRLRSRWRPTVCGGDHPLIRKPL